MPSAICFNLDQSKILLSGNGLKGFVWGIVYRNSQQVSGECRPRSGCTFVQSDLALHSPQTRTMMTNRRIRINYVINKHVYFTTLMKQPGSKNNEMQKSSVISLSYIFLFLPFKCRSS